MTENNRTQWIYRIERSDFPVEWESDHTSDHQTDRRKTEDEGELELLEKARKFFEESCVFNFFGGCAPRHIDLEHV